MVGGPLNVQTWSKVPTCCFSPFSDGVPWISDLPVLMKEGESRRGGTLLLLFVPSPLWDDMALFIEQKAGGVGKAALAFGNGMEVSLALRPGFIYDSTQM